MSRHGSTQGAYPNPPHACQPAQLLSDSAHLELRGRVGCEQVHEHGLAGAHAAPHIEPARRPRVSGAALPAKDALPPAQGTSTSPSPACRSQLLRFGRSSALRRARYHQCVHETSYVVLLVPNSKVPSQELATRYALTALVWHIAGSIHIGCPVMNRAHH